MAIDVSTAPEHWADALASVLRQEIGADRPVRVMLPGFSSPIEVESAHRWGQMLGIRDHQGNRYYLNNSAGIVVLGAPIAPPDPGEKPYWMKVDEPGCKPKKDD